MRPVRSLAAAIGVAVGDELRLEQRLDHPAQGVMDDAVAKRRGTDLAALRLVDDEVGVSSGTVLAGRECIVQLQQPFGESVLEGRGAGRRALAARGLAPGLQQIGERTQFAEITGGSVDGRR
ncbi:MAG: hypothetical protein V5B40_07865 [Candidatus Accumulibacter meliphilus]|jgi:hypothetical protein|uniref:hypothetical protein n=1 Tax=Candidatus Accumulibacter meliphilus TaxID=2211374 RepID=UPI002FC39F31